MIEISKYRDLEEAAFHKLLSWKEKASDVKLLMKWVRTNSHSFNPEGVRAQQKEVARVFKGLAERIQLKTMPPVEEWNERGELLKRKLGPALLMTRGHRRPGRVLLAIHADTVYPSDEKTDTVRLSQGRLYGPGVADAKGGILVILRALELYEKLSPHLHWGWTVFINPDEEIGSPSSRTLLKPLAKSHQWGLVFEPSLPDGSLVAQRKGSGNFSLLARGRSAHAGREHHLGRNAIDALSEAAYELSALTGAREGITVNNGLLRGGTALNVVPDRGLLQFNVRLSRRRDWDFLNARMKKIVRGIEKKRGVKLILKGDLSSPPKPLNPQIRLLQRSLEACCQRLKLPLSWRDTGGVCDGNKLAAFGLPNIDTLGVRGDKIHRHGEYCIVESLRERAQLVALTLLTREAEMHKIQRRTRRR